MTTDTDHGYIPTSDWPDVTTMLDGFGDPSLGATTALEAAPLRITLDDGREIEFALRDGLLTQSADTATPPTPYRAVEARPGIYFVDARIGNGAHTINLTLIVNTTTGHVTVATSRFTNRDGEVRMHTEFAPGHLTDNNDPNANNNQFPLTTQLVGKRIFYRYSPTEHYEHIYLNSGTFVWHCVRGGEAGLADVDPVQMWQVADDLVLLHWSETVMPVESVVLIDLAQQRSIGRMFCWDGPTLAPVHIPFDSRFTVLSDTPYPAE